MSRLYKAGVLWVFASTCAAVLPAADYMLAPGSRIEFSVPFVWTVVGEVEGRFDSFVGEVAFDPEALADSAVQVVIDTASVTTDFEARDFDLRKEAFFDSASYPRATFTSTALERTPGGYLLRGRLELKGVTNEVEVPFELLDLGDGWLANGTARIDRNSFGVGVLPLGGDFVIGDEARIRLYLVLRPVGD